MAASEEQSVEDVVPRITVTGHDSPLTSVAWLPEDRIVTGSLDKTVRIWNLTNDTQEGTPMIHKGVVRAVVTTKDRWIISCAAKDNYVRVWTADTQELVNELSPGAHYGPADCIVLSENEKLLASCHKDWIVFWEMAEMIQVTASINFNSITVARNKTVTRACFSPDSKRLATCYRGGTVIVFDVESGEHKHVGPLEADSSWLGIGAIIWSPEGGRLLCGWSDGSIRSWNPSTDSDENTGELWATACQIDVVWLSLSPDGEWLASGSSEGTVCFWDMKSGDPFGEPLLHGTIINVIAFSHSGEFIASGGGGGHISVWRVPWWNNARQQDLHLLDLSAVVPPDRPSNIPPESDFDFLNISAQGRDLLFRNRSRENTSTDLPRAQRSVRSWRWWKRIPRFLLERSNPIYMGRAEPRVYVASRDSPRSCSQQVSSSPEHQAETTGNTSSGESSDESTTTDTTDGLEVSRIGCCGLFSRRQPRSTLTTRQERHDVAVGLSLPSTVETSTPAPASARSEPYDILELSAVVPSNTP